MSLLLRLIDGLSIEFYVEILFYLRFEEFSLPLNAQEVLIGSLLLLSGLFPCKWPLPRVSDIQIFSLLSELPTFTTMSFSWWYPCPPIFLYIHTSMGIKLLIVRGTWFTELNKRLESIDLNASLDFASFFHLFLSTKPCKILYLHPGSFFCFLSRQIDTGFSPPLSCYASLRCRIIVTTGSEIVLRTVELYIRFHIIAVDVTMMKSVWCYRNVGVLLCSLTYHMSFCLDV